MAVRGKYTPQEEAMLAATDSLFDRMVGWDDSVGRMIVSEEAMVTTARALDPWNLLWRKEEYGKNTRWRGAIAHPFFLDRFPDQGVGDLPASSACGYQQKVFIGEDWRFYVPVRKNDVLRVFRRRPEIVDVTPADGSGSRTFGLVEVDKDYVNQDERVAASVKVYSERRFLAQPLENPEIPEYAYTMEELCYIAELIRQEHVRGAEPRYWEDVEIGSRTLPTVLGPSTVMDNLMCHLVTPDPLLEVSAREWLLLALDRNLSEEFLLDEETGLFRMRGGPAALYWSDRAGRAAGGPCAALFPKLSRALLCRCVTNWMGNNAFLTRFRWRHVSPSWVGDTLIARGRVTNKKVDAGLCLADLSVSAENLRGMITDVALATVVLPSRMDTQGRIT